MTEMFAGVALIITLVVLGIGIVMGLLGCAMLAILVMAGVLTSSTVVGVLRGKMSSGLRALWYQCALLGGIPAGITGVFATQLIFTPWQRDAEPWLAGALGGMAGALSLAAMIDFLLRKAAAWVAARNRGSG